MTQIKSIINNEHLENIAVITQNGEHYTYQMLSNDVSKIARSFKSRSLLFIIGSNDYSCLVHYLAALESDTVVLFLSASIAAAQLKTLLYTYRPEYVLAKAREGVFSQYDVLRYHEQYQFLGRTLSKPYILHSNLAFLASTSGSTGSPKLVRFSKQNLFSNVQAIKEYLSISQQERAIVHLPISYSYGLSIVNSHLSAGASIYLTNETIMEKSFWENMAAHQITSFSGVPFHYESLLRMKVDSISLPYLKTMTQAGGKLTRRHLMKMQKLTRKLGINFWVMYGQTEASPRISYLRPSDLKEHLGSIGKAIPGGKLVIHDKKGNDITESGEIGELVYRGENVCLGYAENFSDLSKGDENQGFLKTGDLASCKQGYFYIEGRLKRFIKIFGNRISLSHVETTLQNLGYESIAFGTDNTLNIAIVKSKDFDVQTLKKTLGDLFSINYTTIQIQLIARIPRLENGKVDYQCLMK
ncbi:AMP-dependent synthetase [Candidatus Saccharibacteria bacterium]|nr:AMP-dependent synthetase [Candidatus Saccharibacteria bacterium]MEC8965638.1 AMP-binding protein [Pseudomonadota bacterium]HCV05183.1 AMP-dependent synthetase [Pseudoalteromonas sp.]|tara:strand:+ start:5310 stop:6719 length:1410 start_codon:yes stop_codon:yes gene_type:complete